MKHILVFLFACQVLSIYSFSQQYPGYTLVAPQSTTARLVDTNGTTFKSWTLTGGSTGYSAYLLPDRSLLRTVVYSGNQFGGGGATGKVQKVDWNGTVVWDYTYSTSTYSMHHDICPMPNGNVLLISYDLHTSTEVTAAGCTTAITVWSEKVVEIQPVGATGGNVVWEWRVWDHLCQNVDQNKNNYVSSIVNNPQLFNVNKGMQKDWLHMNGIDYNAELNQIVVSSHNWNEIFVIDHSTTTAQAAGHSGGNSGKGGDILYRWGNPSNYNATGTKIFNVVHDAHWIPAGCPNAGFLVGFNNGGTTSSSTVDMINPPRNGNNYDITLGNAYAPSTYTSRILCTGKTTNEGNSHQLPNGNHLVCIALAGTIKELDAAGNVLWTYNAGGKIAHAYRYSEAYVNGNGGTPVLTISAPKNVCENTTVSLSADVGGTPGFSFIWTSNPTGFTSSSQSPTFTLTKTTTFIVTASNGTVNLKDSITVNVMPSPIISDIVGSKTVPSGSTQSYSITPVTGGTYTWIVLGGTVNSGQGTDNINVQWPNSNGNGTVTITIIGQNGCTTTKTLNVTFSKSASFSVAPTSLNFQSNADSANVMVSSVISWSASTTANWITLSKKTGAGNDTITVSVVRNATNLSRKSTITFTAGINTQTVTVNQAAIPAIEGKRYVKFAVDMRNQTVNTTGVHVSGDFQEEAGFAGGDWQPNTTPLTQEGTSTIYSTVVLLPVNAKYEYKFLNGDQFYDSEFVPEQSRVLYEDNDNRWFVADSTVGDTIYVGPLMYAGNAPYNKKLLRFRVNMQKAKPISTDGVFVAGTFPSQAHSWSNAGVMMYSFDSLVYESLIYVDSNTTSQFKYYNGKGTLNAESVPVTCAVNGNRSAQVVDDVVLAAVCFNECSLCSTTLDVTDNTINSTSVIYPNPFASTLTVEVPFGSYTVVVRDALGKEVMQQQLRNSTKSELHMPQMATGVYVVQI
ncbi:MAG: aryl-sulfate sulfotransferase, partial [Candidatus Kapabacteria bacterium]|nr:aryl-sulfate sulfotransferase [Candidatus Kapabacteria bacterium]